VLPPETFQFYPFGEKFCLKHGSAEKWRQKPTDTTKLTYSI
jgi:hypothetical protein